MDETLQAIVAEVWPTLVNQNASVIEPCELAAPPGSRYDHMVKRFSREWETIGALRILGVGRSAAAAFIRSTCVDLGVPAPEPSLHRGRGPHTGYCMPARVQAVARTNEEQVQTWEQRKASTWPAAGRIRLGDPTALVTIAHELGHHVVYLTEPVGTPVNGKRWVEHFDRAASAIDRRQEDR